MSSSTLASDKSSSVGASLTGLTVRINTVSSDKLLSVTVTVTFPENYGSKELAGKEAVFECHIHEIHEKTDADVNDDLAKKLGMDDLEALKKILREQMQGEYEQFTRMKLKRELLDQLDEGHSFELPPIAQPDLHHPVPGIR